MEGSSYTPASKGGSSLSSISSLGIAREEGLDEDDVVAIKRAAEVFDMEMIFTLSLSERQLSSCPRPLSLCTSIVTLDLCRNRINDVSPLSSLHALQHLLLDENNISSIAPLGVLAHLYSLSLAGNFISSTIFTQHLLPCEKLHRLTLRSRCGSLSNPGVCVCAYLCRYIYMYVFFRVLRGCFTRIT